MKSELASPAAVRDLVNLRDFEAAARARLDPVYYDYFASGAQDEITVAANEAAFRRRALVPAVHPAGSGLHRVARAAGGGGALPRTGGDRGLVRAWPQRTGGPQRLPRPAARCVLRQHGRRRPRTPGRVVPGDLLGTS